MKYLKRSFNSHQP